MSKQKHLTQNSAAMRKLRILLSLVLGATLALATSGPGQVRAAENVIQFALSTPLSGPAASWDTQHKQGMELVFDEINEEGGLEVGGKQYKLEVVVYAYQDVIAEGVDDSPICDDETVAMNGKCRHEHRSSTGHVQSGGHKITPTCPPPTIGHGQEGECILPHDVVLSESFSLDSNTKLNCKGHRISPSQVGTPDIAATAANEYQPSVPEIGILINGGGKIKVHNCIIDNFDFGVLIANSKRTNDDGHAGKIMLKNNMINGHYYGVRILRSDDIRIENNSVSYAMNARGKGIWTQGDSDFIEIIDNIVDGSTGIETVLVPLLPGGPQYNGRMDSIRFERGGVREGSLAGTVLLNLIIDNQLYQYPYFGPDTTQIAPTDWMEGAVVSGNYVNAAPSTGTFAIALGGGLLAPVVDSNTVINGGAHFSGANHEVHTLPSTCSDDSSRLCVTNADCFIPQIDTASKGTCTVTTHVVTQGVIDGIMSANTIIGPFSGTPLFFNSAISTFPNSMNAMIVGNSVSNVIAGIHLHSGGPLTTADVTNNVVSNSRFALQLANNGAGVPTPGGLASAFTANVSLNDFVGSTGRAINVINVGTYNLPTELSFNGGGNYWAHTCAEGGFLASDSPLPIIKDSHPYGEPVASVLTLPATCF